MLDSLMGPFFNDTVILHSSWSAHVRVMFFFYVYDILLMYKDPVCNMIVDEKETRYISQAGGRNVYLCSAACKREFENNSYKYGNIQEAR
jgi:YHS domain-containing protein